MAKKSVKVGLKSAGAEPASGDVNISYKGSRIAGLSESSTAVLETEDTIVTDDIEVEYTKPASGGFQLRDITITNEYSGGSATDIVIECIVNDDHAPQGMLALTNGEYGIRSDDDPLVISTMGNIQMTIKPNPTTTTIITAVYANNEVITPFGDNVYGILEAVTNIRVVTAFETLNN